MKRMIVMGMITVLLSAAASICENAVQSKRTTEGYAAQPGKIANESMNSKENSRVDDSFEGSYTRKTRIADVISDPVFGNYGRLIFPVNSG